MSKYLGIIIIIITTGHAVLEGSGDYDHLVFLNVH